MVSMYKYHLYIILDGLHSAYSDQMKYKQSKSSNKMKCWRCHIKKRGIHKVILLGYDYWICQRCAVRCMNLLSLLKSSKSDRQKNWAERSLFDSRAIY